MKANAIEKEKLLELHKSFSDLKPRLVNYIGRRLNQGIKNGIIKKGFYSIEGLLDDIYLMSFDDMEKDPAAFKPKISIFKNTIDKLNEVLKRGKIFSNNIPVNKLLESELIELREDFTTDADGDLIPEEELTDISYHLKENEDKVLLMDIQTQQEIEDNLGNYDDILLQDERFGKSGSLTKTIVELAVFGHLSSIEIAEVMNIDINDVQFVFDRFKI